MKQFQWVDDDGRVHGPYIDVDAATYLPAAERFVLEELVVGGQYTDESGDRWTRLPDARLPDENELAKAVTAEPWRDERLECIATAALQGLLSSPPFNESHSEDLARWAVNHARALIAELDKPE